MGQRETEASLEAESLPVVTDIGAERVYGHILSGEIFWFHWWQLPPPVRSYNICIFVPVKLPR